MAEEVGCTVDDLKAEVCRLKAALKKIHASCAAVCKCCDDCDCCSKDGDDCY